MEKFNLEEYTDTLRRSFLRMEKPRNDWRLLLASSFVVLLMLAAFSFYLFIQISKDEIFISQTEEVIIIDTLNRSLLNETLDAFREKASRLKEIQRKRPKVIDPTG